MAAGTDMIKKVSYIIFILLLIIPLGGCWNYRGLNEMTIVAGVAIDKNPQNGNYQLSFEILDLTAPIKEEGLSAKIVESEGKTLFDAARNAKKREVNKLYFGQMQIVVISEEIARNQDISDIIDWFLRDGECRETMCVIISQEKTARDILNIGEDVIATQIHNIIKSDKEITASTIRVELYKIFSILKAEGKSLTLPAIHNVINDGKPTSEANGIAVFKDKRLIGFLTPDESKYYLFAVNQIEGGVLTFASSGEDSDNISLEISKNSTKRSVDFRDGKVKIIIKTDTTVYLNEFMGYNDALDEQQLAALEDAAGAELENNINLVIQKVQSEYDSDIFGFGNMIYKKDLQLWNQLSDTWEEQFKSLEVEVQSDVHIVNTASIKES
jgi:spore germination protein KC